MLTLIRCKSIPFWRFNSTVYVSGFDSNSFLWKGVGRYSSVVVHWSCKPVVVSSNLTGGWNLARSVWWWHAFDRRRRSHFQVFLRLPWFSWLTESVFKIPLLFHCRNADCHWTTNGCCQDLLQILLKVWNVPMELARNSKRRENYVSILAGGSKIFSGFNSESWQLEAHLRKYAIY